jgi:hypothetical protein
MHNVPLVFQLWENPQKKITYEKEVCNYFMQPGQNINYINSRSQKTSCCPCSRQQTNNYVQHAGIRYKSRFCYSEHRKMPAKQQHVCKEMNQYTNNTNRKWFLSFSIEWTNGANERK